MDRITGTVSLYATMLLSFSCLSARLVAFVSCYRTAAACNNEQLAAAQVLPTLGVLFVLVVIIILRAAWKPLPSPKVTAEELLRQAKAAAGKD